MSIKDKAEELAASAKLKAEELAKKAKNIDVEGIKNAAGEAKGNMSAESLKTLSGRNKAIGLVVVGAVLIGISMLGGGSSGDMSALSKPFPTSGTIEEQCSVIADIETNIYVLIDNDVPAADIKLELQKNAISYSALAPSAERAYHKKRYSLAKRVKSIKGEIDRAKSQGKGVDIADKAPARNLIEKNQCLDSYKK